MTWSFLAPVLSATSSIERCCTISLERYLTDGAPALHLRERARLDEPHDVPDLEVPFLVMHVELRGRAVLLAVLLVRLHAVDADDDRLVHLGGDDHALIDPLRLFLLCHSESLDVDQAFRRDRLRVRICAMTFLASRISRTSESWRAVTLKRKSRTLFRKSASMRSSSRSVFSRNSLIFIRVRCLLLDESGLHRELVGREA